MNVAGRSFGSNMTKLIIHKMSNDAVPPGGDYRSAVDFIMTPGKMEASAKAASEWALQAVESVRAAHDYAGDRDEEAIAGMILKKLEERIDQQRRARRNT